MSGNLGEPLGALRAGGFDEAAPTVDALGLASSGLLIEALLGTVDLSAATISTLTITERMGTPDTCTLELADLEGYVDLEAIADLGDIHIASAAEHLFRGQATTVAGTSIAGTPIVMKTISISGEGYERLIPGCPVAFPPPTMYLEQPDGTIVNTYGMTTSGQPDKPNVTGLFQMWWSNLLGSTMFSAPIVDADTKVVETGANPGALFAPLDRIMLDAALAIVAEITGAAPHLVSWLDAALRFHWTDGADPTKCDPAPFEIDANAFGAGVVMPTKITVTREAGGIMGGAITTGALPWVGGLYSGHAWAPWGQISSDRAITVAEGTTFAGRYLIETFLPKISGKATIPAGYDGWHKGQWVIVTDPANGLTRHGCLIQGVVRRLVSPGDDPPSWEYDIDFGDAPHRSLGRETAIPQQGWPPGTTITSTSYTVTTDDPNPTLAKPANIKAQLCDFKGAPLGTKGIAGVWNLDINGTRVTDPTDTGQAFYLDTASGTTDETGRVFNVLHVGASATLVDYADPFFETVQPP
jgi:hypothetical protein